MKKTYIKGSLKKLNDEEIKTLTGRVDVDASSDDNDNSYISKDFDINDIDSSGNIAMSGYYGT